MAGGDYTDNGTASTDGGMCYVVVHYIADCSPERLIISTLTVAQQAFRRWQHRNGAWSDPWRWWTAPAARLERHLRSLRPVLRARAPFTRRERDRRLLREWTRRRL